MARTGRGWLAIAAASLALLAGILGASQAIGSPLRWVQLVGLIAAGAAFGAGLTKAIADRARDDAGAERRRRP